jgi:photosystem II stability/assembly factor-like uncharacterized protein
MVGPTVAGRVTTVRGIPSQPHTFYMGSTGGGVWRTTNAGETWDNVSDGQIAVGSMGSIDVSLTDPNIVWVGTGSIAIRSNVSTGRGVYRSVDGAKTWQFVGLRDAGQIGALRIHPTDPNIVYVAALGNAFGRNTERGIFRTRDGGKTWDKVLYVSDSTGGADVEFEPGNPSTLYATMWRGERKPWTIISGANEGGIYKSTDGGDTWTKLGGGLPTGLIGKSNVSISAANPTRVYALIEAKPGIGLYRSDDAGKTWTLMNGDVELVSRGFYYTDLEVDPTNPDIVYVMTEGFDKSVDGGKTFKPTPASGGDNHELWINPRDHNIMILANDQGATVTRDGGMTWSSQDNQPTAELYQVATDNQFPYRLYGAQQDNSTWIVPSNPTRAGREEWRTGPGCETGPIIPHPTNPDTVYGSCKGLFSRMNLRSGQEAHYYIGMQSLYGNPGRDLIWRIQRTAPLETSPHDTRLLYYGTQYVHRTRDEGVTWERISPDLTEFDPKFQGASGEPITRDVTGEEFYSTLYAIRESPKAKGVIWAGANDGPYHVTRDNGKSWTKVTPPDLPKGCRVQNIDASPHRAGGAYYASVCYLLGDFKPYAYKTDDYGKTWKRITPGNNGIPDDYPVRVVREDPNRAGLLYAGTEFGMFVSFNDGESWESFQLNLPHTPITDIDIHGRDLAISTQGRAFWVLDDLTPLYTWASTTTAEQLHLFAPRDAYRAQFGYGFGRGTSSPQYQQTGASIDYYLAPGFSGDLKLEILDEKDNLVRSYSSTVPEQERNRGARALPKNPGVNRFFWDLTQSIPSGGYGPMVVPGKFKVRLTSGATTQAQPLTVRIDPRSAADGITIADLRAVVDYQVRVAAMSDEVRKLTTRVRTARKRLASAQNAGDTLTKIDAILAKLETEKVRYGKPGLEAHITYLAGGVSGDQKVGKDILARFVVLRKELDEVKAETDTVLGKE